MGKNKGLQKVDNDSTGHIHRNFRGWTNDMAKINRVPKQEVVYNVYYILEGKILKQNP